MSVFTAVVLGLIQGIAEFLPISSSGHLAIARHLFGVQGFSDIPEFFDVLLHIGTLAAVFAAYWREICVLIAEFFAWVDDLLHHRETEKLTPARRMILLIIVGSLPLFTVLLFKDRITDLNDNMIFIGCALLFTGGLLFASDRVRRGSKTEKNAALLDAVVVGFTQAFSTCPGISRSGITITTGCFCGFKRSFALRFSFILSIPAVIGANFLTLLDVLKAGVIVPDIPVYLLGVLVAAASGYASICLLRFIARRGRFGGFAYYCWAVGALTIALTVL